MSCFSCLSIVSGVIILLSAGVPGVVTAGDDSGFCVACDKTEGNAGRDLEGLCVEYEVRSGSVGGEASARASYGNAEGGAARGEDHPCLICDDVLCLTCHGSGYLEPKTERGRTLSLYVDPGVLARSVHGRLSCTDCHGGALTFAEAPHNGGEPLRLLCDGCHDKEAAAFERSAHYLPVELGDDTSGGSGVSASAGLFDVVSSSGASGCSTCHGGHDILAASDENARTSRSRLRETCGRCHGASAFSSEWRGAEDSGGGSLLCLSHGREVLEDGSRNPTTCVDCHAPHDVLDLGNPDLPLGPRKQLRTCGRCHPQAEALFSRSAHNRGDVPEDRRLVCTSCHPGHQEGPSEGQDYRLTAGQMCGRCHQAQLRSYRDTLHGKAMVFGRTEVAACFDCHGAHYILEHTDPVSRVSDIRRKNTCSRCHPGAGQGFAGYLVHADYRDRAGYPLLFAAFVTMTGLMAATFGFFTLHTLLWFYRSLRSRAVCRRTSSSANAWGGDPGKEYFVRFTSLDRSVHALMAVSFFLLVFTGMPLKYSSVEWAQWLFELFRGQARAAILHRAGAVVILLCFAVHVFDLVRRVYSRRHELEDQRTGRVSPSGLRRFFFGPDSPLPNRTDLEDLVAHLRWFVGRGRKPRFDRFAYWEKFDYLAAFWGITFIGASGLIMWFPELFTRVLPGWFINIALIFHSEEALLAAGFVFLFHFFNTHFRPEKFPMNEAMFSGMMTREELLEERGRLYDRWETEGSLERHRRATGGRLWPWVGIPAGYLALGLGLALIVAIAGAVLLGRDPGPEPGASSGVRVPTLDKG